MSGPEAALALCRFVHDAAGMLLWGAFAYLVALVPRDLGREVGQRLSVFRLCATLAVVLTTVVTLPIQVAGIGDGWPAALDPASITAVLFDTSVGRAWQMQMLAALLLGAALAAPERWQPAVTAIASGLALATLALAGHAAMQEGWLGVAHRLNDAVHVLAGGGWVGALVPLLMILGPGGTPARRGQAGIALRRFSTAGHAAVALVIATGALNTRLVLGRWPLDPSSPYQALLAAKIALVAAMVGLALVNRYAIVPRLDLGRPAAERALVRSTLAEIGLAALVVALVAVFGLLDPA